MSESTPNAATLFEVHRDAVEEIMHRHGIRKLVAFGSRARGDAESGSDLDLAADIRPGTPPLAILAAEADLEEELGLKVHLAELPNPKLDQVLQREGVRFAP